MDKGRRESSVWLINDRDCGADGPIIYIIFWMGNSLRKLF